MDKNKTYTVEGYRGIAFNFIEMATELDEDGCELETGEAIMVMVGADRKFYVAPTDCHEIDEDKYCHECGQIGCNTGR